MKKILIIIIFVLLIPSFSVAPKIDVNITGLIGGDIEYFGFEEMGPVKKFSIQWYNTKSVNCMSRMELKINKEGKYKESLWSKEKKMFSGSSDHFEIFWMPEEKGNYTAQLFVHHCNGIMESQKVNFTVNSLMKTKEKIKLEAKNLPENKIEVKLESNETVEKIILIPTDYPLGWIFSGEEIKEIKNEKEIKKIIEYEPSVWSSETITIQAISPEGYSSKKVNLTLKKEEYLWDKYGFVLFLIAFSILVLSLLSNMLLLRKINHRKL